MKQTKKLTRSQRELLERNGIKNIEDIRFDKETKNEYIFYNTCKKESVVVEKN